MALDISQIAQEEKNSLGSQSAFVWYLEVAIPNNTPVYLTNNTEDAKSSTGSSWRGQAWAPVPFDIGEVNEDDTGNVNGIELKISNINRLIGSFIMEYDNYYKVNNNTNERIVVTLHVVNTYNLDDINSEVTYTMDVGSYSLTAEWATFTLEPQNLFNKKFPKNIYTANSCRWKYLGNECDPQGNVDGSTYPTCNKTFSDCKLRANSQRYGAFPSINNTIAETLSV